MHTSRSFAAAVCVTTLLLTACARDAAPPDAAAASVDPLSIHRQALTLDTHLDTPMWLSVEGWRIEDRHSVADDGSQVDLPRIEDGALDGGFWATYIPQGPLTPEGRAAALQAGLTRIGEIRTMVETHPDRFALALQAEDAARIAATGRHFVFLSMENGYPLGLEPVALLARFYDLGLRMASPVHFLNNDLATSSTDANAAGLPGLTPLGEQWVAEANRLGILIDASHASDAALDKMLELSRAPIILSHSGARAVFDHPRNLDDEHLRRVADSGGVIQVTAYSDYLIANAPNAERQAAIRDARAGASRTLEGRRAQQAKLREVDARYPANRASIDDFINHLLHVIRVAGVDHAGIGLDFDGGGGVTGLDEASDYPRITERLLAEGYSREDVEKIWGGNALRVLAQAQQLAGPAQR
ncbi:MAG: dipeptidase [Nevskiaceae bacterium]|nr:dipeptidase [Nevskiaceae bacterium]